MSKAFYAPLKNRGLLHIEGQDRYDFLQGLVSNDVHKVKSDKIVYACLLTPQGKFLHDFFILEGDGFLMIDCEGGTRALDLYNRLKRYTLRADVFLSVEENNAVYAVMGESDLGIVDPRYFKMGRRIFEKPDLPEASFDEWDAERIALGIPDGSRDMEVERSSLLECNIDKLHGIDWNKGCYMGQELTARMHHRNLGKKHLYTIISDTALPTPFSDIHLNGVLAGNMRSSCGNIGLALLKDDAIQGFNNDKNSLRILGL